MLKKEKLYMLSLNEFLRLLPFRKWARTKSVDDRINAAI